MLSRVATTIATRLKLLGAFAKSLLYQRNRGLGMSGRFGKLLVLLAILGGCGGEAKVPVSGTVKYKDQPLGEVNIVLIRADGKTATATTDSSGAFAGLTTDAPQDGALPGEYKVAITPVSTITSDPTSASDYSAPKPSKFPPKFMSAESSGLQVKVEPGMQPLELTLKE